MNRNEIIANFQRGIKTEGYDVYHCADVDKYIIRKKKVKASESTVPGEPNEEPVNEPKTKLKKFGAFIV